MQLNINGHVADISMWLDLWLHQQHGEGLGLDEIVLSADDEPEATRRFWSLIVMVSGPRAFLTFFRSHDDAGINSCDPTYTGPIAATHDFHFSNGEVDPYPVWWTIPTADALKALEYTSQYRVPAPFVTWREAGEMSQF